MSAPVTRSETRTLADLIKIQEEANKAAAEDRKALLAAINQLAATSQQLKATDERQEETLAAIIKLNTKTDTISTKAEILGNKLDTIDAQVTEKVDELAKKLDVLDADKLSDNIDALDADRLSTKVNELVADTISSKFDALTALTVAQSAITHDTLNAAVTSLKAAQVVESDRAHEAVLDAEADITNTVAAANGALQHGGPGGPDPTGRNVCARADGSTGQHPGRPPGRTDFGSPTNYSPAARTELGIPRGLLGLNDHARTWVTTNTLDPQLSLTESMNLSLAQVGPEYRQLMLHGTYESYLRRGTTAAEFDRRLVVPLTDLSKDPRYRDTPPGTLTSLILN
mmetsp:Transcript_16390/g.66238  ORF Transcript_16390/g.66238 Transcript_16390/m.66238 type:complete len:342 (-) Transcript_16390:480-1505(-)